MHKKFKRLIHYKDKLGDVSTVRNQQFGHNIGHTFEER